MPWDAISIKAITTELNLVLATSRLEKIRMPEPNSLLLNFHTREGKTAVFVSAGTNPCCYLTTSQFQSPATAPAFCMHLRKRLGGAILKNVSSDGAERVITFEFLTKNELRDDCLFYLVAELMGKHSNIIAVDQDGKVTDSIKHITASVSSKRIVLPGARYLPPPSDDRIPLSDTQGIISRIKEMDFAADLQKYMQAFIKGAAPVTIAEIIHRARENAEQTDLAEKIAKQSVELFNKAASGNLTPCTVQSGDKYSDFFIEPYRSIEGQYTFHPTVNVAADKIMGDKVSKSSFNSKLNALKSILSAALKKASDKLATAEEKLTQCQKAETYRIYGELIISSAHSLKKGASEAQLYDYYNDRDIKVPLDPLKSPTQNAQKYFKLYNKLKKAAEYAEAAQKDALIRVQYLENIAHSLEICKTLEDLEEIEEEMEKAALIKKRAVKKPAATKSSPYTVDYKGFTILVGRNNIQNDRLVKSSLPTDIWFHAKGVPGSHVVLKTQKETLPPEDVIVYAAELAAGYSKARTSDKAAVDFTRAKSVKKIPGTAAGLVSYTGQTTIMVTPKTLD